MGLSGFPVASSMDPPTRPASAARRMVSATVSGSSPNPFSRSPDTGRSVASTRAGACAMHSLRATRPSRLPSTAAEAALEVASALKPRAASTRAEPASQGLGIRKAPGPWCRALKRAALALWVRAMEDSDDAKRAAQLNRGYVSLGDQSRIAETLVLRGGTGHPP